MAQVDLRAAGPQDAFVVSDDPSDSLFRPCAPRHSNFAVYQKKYSLGEGPFIGQTIKHVLKPRAMGDLLSNAWLKCTLPELPTPGGVVTLDVVQKYDVTTVEPASYVIPSQPGYVISSVLVEASVKGGATASVTLTAPGDETAYSVEVDTDTNAPTASVTFGDGNSVSGTAANGVVNIDDGTLLAANAQTDTGGATTYVRITGTFLLVQPVYADQVGRALIKEVRFRLGSHTLETLTSEMYVIRDQLMASAEDRDALKYMINGGNAIGELPDAANGAGPMELYIPLDFFFCHRKNYTWRDGDRRPYFPLCAARDQEIEISIEFHTRKFFTYVDTAFDLAGGGDPDPFDLGNVSLVLEMIDLTQAERNVFTQEKYRIAAPTMFKEPNPPTFMVGDDAVDVRFARRVQSRMTAWFFRSTLFEDIGDDRYYAHRFNFSTRLTTDPDTQDEFNVLRDATLHTGEGSANNFGISHLYYKHVQPAEHGCNPPVVNVYMISHALAPLSSKPTGALDILKGAAATLKQATIGRPDSDRLLIDNPFSLHVYHYGSFYLNVNKGRITPAFS